MKDPFIDCARPRPALHGLAKEFYDWCRLGELRFQRCTQCGSFRHVPREVCAECSSFGWEWVRSSGKGTIYTWTVVERALHPAYAKAVPYAPVVVEMAEGVRLLSRIIDCAPEDLRMGMRVRVAFEPLDAELTVPCFRRA
ncbi:MAG: OB-fold domain-containing protein [Betaproteobacteria bacterium]|nr:OB-fold domain-containing protein [Betaproteobacteria bacterium]